MSEKFLDGRVELHRGDCLDVLQTLAENSIDAVVCDPPYHLTSTNRGSTPGSVAASKDVFARVKSGGFMGTKWDGGDIAFRPDVWREVLRVLKPGAHLVAFGGDRTFHRLACAIEDAGFEIRGTIAWVFGQGFPKSLDVSKAIDRAAGAEREVVGINEDYLRRKPNGMKTSGANTYNYSQSQYETDARITAPATDAAKQWNGFGTALKPAMEMICLARKPLSEGSVAANVLRFGTGAINIDGCRVETQTGDYDHPGNSGIANNRNIYGDFANANQSKPNGLGRWPANLIHDRSAEVLAAFPDSDGAMGAVRGTEKPKVGTAVFGDYGNRPAQDVRGDGGSAAQFFASFPNDGEPPEIKRLWYGSKADVDDRLGSSHPTVKPVDLMQWLCRLVTPPGGLVLDPFAGTGTTGEAAFRESMRCVLIEREAEYCADIRRRMVLALASTAERRRQAHKEKQKRKPLDDQGTLFGGQA